MAVRARTVILGTLGLVVLLILGGITAMGWELVLGPKAREVTSRTFESTPVRLARGEYLTNAAGCFHCHSEPDLSKPEYPVLPGRRGAGWKMPMPELGSVVAPNITPNIDTGIGQWTDDEIARAIQEGVSRDGSPLFPVMPYMNFRNLTDEDLASIVVYLRSMPGVRNILPRTELIFPLSVLVNLMPQPLASHEPAPARTTPEARGEYLVRNVASCQDCHTPFDDRGQPIPGLEFAGGAKFSDPGNNMAPVFSLNITQDASGIAHYDEGLFSQTLTSGQIPGRMLSHIMPFEGFKHLTEADLSDMFAYLKSVPKVKHRVTNTDPPTLCPLCNQTHGLGDRNVK